MTNRFSPYFISVWALHALVIFGGLKLSQDLSQLSSLSKPNQTFKLQVASTVRPNPPAPVVQKKVVKEVAKAKTPAKVQETPVETKKVSDEVVKETVISSAATQHINDLRSQYKAQLRSKIEENKHYPPMSRRLGQEGTVVVAFTLLKDGHIINITIDTPSPFERLNASALEAVKKVKRFLPIPDELGENKMDIKVPIKFFTI
jgi:protein TonB